MWRAESRWSRLRRLTGVELRLLAEALLLLTFARGVTAFLPGPRLLWVLRRQPRLRAAAGGIAADAVLLAVDRAAARHPLRPRCLERALTGRWMLARRGHRSALVIGARGGSFAAHAWLEVGQQPARDPQAGAFAPIWRSPA